MVVFAAVVLFAWGAVAAGYGAYAASAALATQNTFHATQAGIALLIATVSVTAGFLVVVVGRLGRVLRRAVSPAREEGSAGH